MDTEVGLHNVLYFSLLTFKWVFNTNLYNIYSNNSLCVKCQLCWPYLHTPTRSSTWAYRITTLFVTWRLPSVLLTSLDCHVKCDEIYRRPQIKMPPESPPEFNPTNARWKTNKPRANISKVHLPRPRPHWHVWSNALWRHILHPSRVWLLQVKPQVNEIYTRCWPTRENGTEYPAGQLLLLSATVLVLFSTIFTLAINWRPERRRYVQHKSSAGTSASTNGYIWCIHICMLYLADTICHRLTRSVA